MHLRASSLTIVSREENQFDSFEDRLLRIYSSPSGRAVDRGFLQGTIFLSNSLTEWYQSQCLNLLENRYPETETASTCRRKRGGRWDANLIRDRDVFRRTIKKGTLLNRHGTVAGVSTTQAPSPHYMRTRWVRGSAIRGTAAESLNKLSTNFGDWRSRCA